MKKPDIVIHPWKIIEKAFNPNQHPITESLMSLGNGRMGQRANFEETYTGEYLRGSYVGGVYYPDKTRVGWWKNGYPEYFAKIINSTNWIGIDIQVNGVDREYMLYIPDGQPETSKWPLVFNFHGRAHMNLNGQDTIQAPACFVEIQ